MPAIKIITMYVYRDVYVMIISRARIWGGIFSFFFKLFCIDWNLQEQLPFSKNIKRFMN